MNSKINTKALEFVQKGPLTHFVDIQEFKPFDDFQTIKKI